MPPDPSVLSSDRRTTIQQRCIRHLFPDIRKVLLLGLFPPWPAPTLYGQLSQASSGSNSRLRYF
ncbi:hypothetical protein I7I48_11476 [Histoplasma ohiense]|nr:hypothetical protein I7I48_11476 [Histoplasma ohiense (nom. inval.)]